MHLNVNTSDRWRANSMSNALRPHKPAGQLEYAPVSGEDEPSARYGYGSRSLLQSRYAALAASSERERFTYSFLWSGSISLNKYSEQY